MSRIGKKPIEILPGVEVEVDGNRVTVKGPKGQLSRFFRSEVKIERRGREIVVSPRKKTKNTKAFWGLTRALINNMVEGVVKGYEKKLEIRGLGYKANIKDKDLELMVGFTHPILINIPEGIDVSVDKSIITVSGIDKELVGLIASKIRKTKPPEPYKGKGIRYLGEEVRRKAGKKVATGGLAGQ